MLLDFNKRYRVAKVFGLLIISNSALYSMTIKDVISSCDKSTCQIDFSYDLNNKKLPGYFQKIEANKIIIGFSDSKFFDNKAGIFPVNVGPFLSFEAKEPNEKKVIQVEIDAKGITSKGMLKKVGKNTLRFYWPSNKSKTGKWMYSSAKAPEEKVANAVVIPEIKKEKDLKVQKAEIHPAKKVEVAEVVKEQANKNDISRPSNTLDQFVKSNSSNGELTTSKTFTLKSISRNVFVTSEKVSLFEKPNKSSKKIQILEFGTELKRLDVEKDFYKVSFNNLKGYVSRSDVAYDDELTSEQKNQLIELAREMVQKRKDTQLADTSKVVQEVTAAWKSKERLHYSSFGRRDPFIPLENVEVDGISIDEIRLVGIIWDKVSPLVILEDVRADGVSYTLKEGDPIINGKIYKINPQEVIFQVTEFGVTRNFSIPLPQSENKE